MTTDHLDPRRGPRGCVYGLAFSLCLWVSIIALTLLITKIIGG